jgi:hypothetical protein
VTVTEPPPISVPDTGAGPHAALHCCTVKLSLTPVIDQAPSKGPSAWAARAQSSRHALAQSATMDGKRRAPTRFEATAAWRLADWRAA